MKFPKLNTQSQQREAVVQGRSLSPYRLRCNMLLKNDHTTTTRQQAELYTKIKKHARGKIPKK
ncbi:MAG: hypothetical protein LBJ00_07725 [Planctomycetaceae bacterium]|nr:hypothetical protein [Planctomycetaceae bacterium]